MSWRARAKSAIGPLSYDEAHLVRAVFDLPGVMIDVGAHVGGALIPYVRRGWRVHAFEPEPSNMEALQGAVGDHPLVTLSDRAVSDVDGLDLTLYGSALSTGIPTLHPFHPSHVPVATVRTVTLASYLEEKRLGRVDFLKVDAEGFDLFVLKGFPWAAIQPRVVVCEFEDRKSKPLGYVWQDLAELLAMHGYRVMVSEWYPVTEYGERHRWRRLVSYPVELHDSSAWGNLVAVRTVEDERAFRAASARFVRTLAARALLSRLVTRWRRSQRREALAK